jgi:hemerythrin-like domain-containing protein
MKPIETLSNEHGLIRHFLDNLDLAARHIEEGRLPSRAFFDKALEFARGFADGYHHFKEEHVMFVRLAQVRRGEVDAQLDALRHQHERGRELVSEIGRRLDGYEVRDPMATTAMLEAVASYTALLRLHIHTEDHVFYPMARKLLGDDDFEAIGAEFEKQREQQGADTFERFHKVAMDMGSILTHLRATDVPGTAH